jgi:hypothetical protein
MCRAIHRRCSSKSPEPQRGSSLTRSTAADVDRPTPPEPGGPSRPVGPPAYASSSHSSALLLASVAVSRMLCPAVRHGMPASWRAVPRPAPARNDRTSARGQGAGQMGGGHADAESGTNTPMLLARSRGPDDHLVGVPTWVHPQSRDLLVRRCSWVARSPRQSGSHFHAVDAWRPDHLAGPGRPRGAAANTATPARHSRWFLRRLDPVPQEAAHVLHPIGRRGTRLFRLPPPCWAPPNAVLVWSAAAGFIGVR